MSNFTKLEIGLMLVLFVLFLTLLDAVEAIMELQVGLPVSAQGDKITVIDGDCKVADTEK
jgi:hypothetical protein